MPKIKVDVSEGPPLEFEGHEVATGKCTLVRTPQGQCGHTITLYECDKGFVAVVEYTTDRPGDRSRRVAFRAEGEPEMGRALSLYDPMADMHPWSEVEGEGIAIPERRALVRERFKQGVSELLRLIQPLPKLDRGWRCELTKRHIPNPSEGWVEFVREERITAFRIVHRQSASESEGLPLEECMGPDGLMRLLGLLELDGSESSSPAAVGEIIRRLHVPFYEHARPYFQQAEADGIVDLEMPPGSYRQALLREILQNYAGGDR